MMFDDYLVIVATWVLLASAGWSVAIATAVAVERCSHGRVRPTLWVGCPPALRHALLAGTGIALVTAPGLPAWGAPPPQPSSTGVGLPTPERPLGAAQATVTDVVVVRAGDCLWHLAQARLAHAAPATQVLAMVRAIHRRNAGTIGPDPDLIQPGQRLVVPRPADVRPHHLQEQP